MNSGENRQVGPASESPPIQVTGEISASQSIDAATREAFLELLEANYLSVVRAVVRDGASRSDAEDAAQHAFAQGWREVRRNRWHRIENPSAWLKRVAINHHRGQDRRTLPVDQVPDAPMTSPGPDELAAQTQAVLAALARLDDETRTVIGLDMDGFSSAQIARELGVGEQRVRDVRKKGRRKLKALLGLDQEGGDR
ncbi:sigma-70 family RNA polymerase sigma factor [Actinomadura sp. KC06]|uniref:RNA polymerase sigma factor n=1 Tax=Actinomadura sp. KC06 TaxID=2530369 RepID=UPI0014044422|nr:sigma-70 family RNA polymerase sigma factor [Actinomadura sp. KC06]